MNLISPRYLTTKNKDIQKSRYETMYEVIRLITEHLMELMIRQNIEIVYGKGKRQRSKEKYR